MVLDRGRDLGYAIVSQKAKVDRTNKRQTCKEMFRELSCNSTCKRWLIHFKVKQKYSQSIVIEEWHSLQQP